MNAGKRRKLLRGDVLARISLWVGHGVPLMRILNDMDLASMISRPAADKLVSMYEESKRDSEDSLTIVRSLNPPWLDPAGAPVQEQPKDWVYIGPFPLGEWKLLA